MTIPAHVNLIGWSDVLINHTHGNPFGWHNDFLEHGWPWLVDGIARGVDRTGIRDPNTGWAHCVIHGLTASWFNVDPTRIPDDDHVGFNDDSSPAFLIPCEPPYSMLNKLIRGNPGFLGRPYAEGCKWALQRLLDLKINPGPWVGGADTPSKARKIRRFHRVCCPDEAKLWIDVGNKTRNHRHFCHHLRDIIAAVEGWNRIDSPDDGLPVVGKAGRYREADRRQTHIGIEHIARTNDAYHDLIPSLDRTMYTEGYTTGNERWSREYELEQGRRPIALVPREPVTDAPELIERGYVVALGIYGDWTREQIEHTTHGELPQGGEGVA